jgi:LAGLIDADG endonuclease
MVDKQTRGVALDPIWEAEFRGFFFGDGYLGITTNGVSRHTGETTFTVRAQITVRDDDIAMLHDIASKIGGKVYSETGTAKRRPIAIWRIRNAKQIAQICDILERGVMPSKKIAEVAVVRRFLSYPHAFGQGFRVTSEIAKIRHACVAEIKRLHSYQYGVIACQQ